MIINCFQTTSVKFLVYNLTPCESDSCYFHLEDKPPAMGWHGMANATPGQQDAILLPPQRVSLQFFYGCLIIVAKERSPKILVEISLGLCTYMEVQSCPTYNLYI